MIIDEDEFCSCLIFSHYIFLLSVLGELMTEELRFGPAMECTHLNISKTLFLLELLAALSALVAVPCAGLPHPCLGLAALLLRLHARRDRVC